MGGKITKKLGDGLMALFGYPMAQENDAERAVRAALSIQRSLADLIRDVAPHGAAWSSLTSWVISSGGNSTKPLFAYTAVQVRVRASITRVIEVEISMNHLEQLVAEWLQYNDYFVRVSVPVGPRDKGGYEGELDVVAVNPAAKHFLHVECSLDALSAEKREGRFARKFEHGRRFAKDVFRGLPVPDQLDQVAVLQFTSGKIRSIGGSRVVTVRELVHEIYDGLKGTSPQSKAVSSNLPLLRTLQVAADATKGALNEYRLLRQSKTD
jgi:hypothetical protein